jgi:hypothetical protein
MQRLFTDGGNIGNNPSTIGGTYAYVLVEDDIIIAKASGIITPERMKVEAVTNNQSELYAIGKGIYALPKDWEGEICTDSYVTIRRVFHKGTMAGVPPWLIEATIKVRYRLKGMKVTYLHLGGHPSGEELRAGVRQDGRPCSEYNVLCDQLCNAEGQAYLADRRVRG